MPAYFFQLENVASLTPIILHKDTTVTPDSCGLGRLAQGHNSFLSLSRCGEQLT